MSPLNPRLPRVDDEFSPDAALAWPELESPIARRRFLQLMGASAALAGLGACTRMPLEAIVPWARDESGMKPGTPLFFATAHDRGDDVRGVLARSHEGRPTKLDGNPDHPASLGGSDVFLQAELLSLYDPERARAPMRKGAESDWSAFVAELAQKGVGWERSRGAGLRILTGPVSSPSVLAQLESLLARFPLARWHEYASVSNESWLAGCELAFGTRCVPVYRLDQAQVILSLDSDFLFSEPMSLAYARQFARARRPRGEGAARTMNRLYQLECSVTLTGAMADHRRALNPDELHRAARGLLGLESSSDFIRSVLADLRAHSGRSLVVAGRHQPEEIHAAAHLLNHELGNVGRTVEYLPVKRSSSRRLEELVREMNEGKVESLFILGGNPAYDAPSDLDFADACARVPWKARLSEWADETSALCDWHLPQAHFLEAWGDLRAWDGTVAIQQPLIAPLYTGKSVLELLAMLGGNAGASGHALVKDFWSSRLGAKRWEEVLEKGVLEGSRPTALRLPAPRREAVVKRLVEPTREVPTLTVVFRPDDSVWDGRYANNAWLQELPRRLTKLTWDNALWIGPELASAKGLQTGDPVELRHAERTVRGPVFVVEGMPSRTITATLGYGRRVCGNVGKDVGFDVGPLRQARSPDLTSGLELRKLGGARHEFALTQLHDKMEGREPVRRGTLSDLIHRPQSLVPPARPKPSLLSLGAPTPASPDTAWGMVIDLNVCIGCQACTIACQAENNIPVVGRTEVLRGRAMHWIRVDRYLTESGETLFQPVPCMHCETAPCEVVCPTAATVHNSEGLNQMVYNRCVGTRYCSNNCPYKVRRFNFFDYSKRASPSERLGANPEVSIRSRGVMEKCTYCVHRIDQARIQADIEGRPIREGEVVTACQAACPTEAIVFGNLRDASSRVSQLKAGPLNYALLDEELDTRPRTSYLARLRNPAQGVPT